MITGQVIINDIVSKVLKSTLKMYVNGEVYREGQRPRDSRKEDIVVVYTSGYAGQRASGVVTINVFVPDIAPFGDTGVLVSDGSRCAQIEQWAQDMADSWTARTGDIRYTLREVIHTNHDDERAESFVVAKFNYEYLNI